MFVYQRVLLTCCRWDFEKKKHGSFLEDGLPGLGYVVHNHGPWLGSKSLKDRVVGPLPNGRTSWLINGGSLTTY